MLTGVYVERSVPMHDYPLYPVPECHSFYDFLNSIHNRFSKKTAFRSKAECWSYQDLYDGVCTFSSRLKNSKNDAYWVRVKSPFLFAIAYFSVIITGNIAFLLEDWPEGFGGDVQPVCIQDDDVLGCLKKGYVHYLPALGACLDINAVCTVVKSSGTTSVAKGVMLSQENLLSDTIAGMQILEYANDSVYLNVLPYSHLFGVVADLLGPLYSGATICFSDNKLDFFGGLRFFKPTNLNVPPILVEGIAKLLQRTKDFETATGGNLRKIMCAGAKLDDSLNDEFERYGLRVYAAYGLTECSPCVSMNRDKYFKPGSAGKILPCCEVKIEDGEIAVRGANVMIGYLNDPEATASVIRNGWLYTGDLGYVDRDGFLFLEGRKTNLIVFEDGTKLMPEALEDLLVRIPGISECMVSSIIQNNRNMLDIVVVSQSDDWDIIVSAVKDICKQQYVFPKVANIQVTASELPKNKLGKIIRTRN